MDAIERIEIAFRTQIIHQFALAFGAYFYENPLLFWNPERHNRILENLDKEAKRSHEVFIGHYRRKYSEPERPPAWMILEISSINTLSNTFRFLKRCKAKKMVAKHFKVDIQIMESWLHAITYVRNISAHHSRLWNRKLTIKPQMLSNPLMPWINSKPEETKLYAFLCCLKYLLNTVNPGTSFTQGLEDLLAKHPTIPIEKMGFPRNWLSEDPVWNKVD